MPTPPPSITPAPQPPPQRGDRATFSDRVDRWVTWMSAVPADFQAVANNVYANALEASAAITAIPPLAGNATKSLRVNAAATAMEWVQDGAALGFTPVQQGTGVGQDTATVKVGRGTGTSALKATIGSTDIGYLATSSTDPATAITAPAFVGNGAGLTGFTASQVNTALGYTPVDPAELAGPDGAAAVGYGSRTIEDRLSDQISVLRFGALGDGAHNDLPAVLDAKAFSGRAHFPRVNDGLTTYYLGGFSAGALDGLVISVDDGVVLSFASNAPYPLYSSIVFASDVRVYFRDISSWYVFQATSVPTHVAPSLPSATTRRNRQALDCTKLTLVTPRENLWNTDDSFAVTAATKTADSLSFGTAAQEAFRGAFVELGAYETVSAIFDDGISPGPVGVIIRGTTGFTAVYSNGVAGNYFTATKFTGAPASADQANLSWVPLGQGQFSSYAPDRAVWSVSRVSATRAFIKLNGKALSAPFIESVGDIQEVGFVCYGANAFTVSGLTLERRTDAAIGMQELGLRVFGDSTAQEFPSYWGYDLRTLLNSLYGVRVGEIENFAVAGQTLDQQFATMQEIGFGNAYYVIVCAGTNNIQGGSSLSSWETLVTDMVDFILAAGRRPVIMLPWMWYGQAQSGGAGQAASRYDQGAPYRMIMERLAYERGAVVVKLTEELPNPSPALLQTDPLAPLLRDNIHQDLVGHRLYAQTVAGALADDYMAMPESVEERPSPSMLLSGATAMSGLRFVYGKSGLASLVGAMGVATSVTGTPLMRCPRHLSPDRSTDIGAIALSSTEVPLGMCWLNLDPAVGAFSISGAPVGTAIIILTGSTWQTAISKM